MHQRSNFNTIGSPVHRDARRAVMGLFVEVAERVSFVDLVALLLTAERCIAQR